VRGKTIGRRSQKLVIADPLTFTQSLRDEFSGRNELSGSDRGYRSLDPHQRLPSVWARSQSINSAQEIFQRLRIGEERSE
jgi:hypothetical protein